MVFVSSPAAAPHSLSLFDKNKIDEGNPSLKKIIKVRLRIPPPKNEAKKEAPPPEQIATKAKVEKVIQKEASPLFVPMQFLDGFSPVETVATIGNESVGSGLLNFVAPDDLLETNEDEAEKFVATILASLEETEKNKEWKIENQEDKTADSIRRIKESYNQTATFSEEMIDSIDLALLKQIAKDPFSTRETFVPDLLTSIEEKAIAGKLEPLFCHDIKNILSRYDQIAILPPQWLGMTAAEILSLACFIAIEMPRVENISEQYFKKDTYGIPRTVVYDKATENVYFLSKRKVKIYDPTTGSEKCLLDASGTSKKVNPGIWLPKDNKWAYLIAQAVNKDTASPRAMEAAKREMRILQELKGTPGIWPLIHVFAHKKQHIEPFAKLEINPIFSKL